MGFEPLGLAASLQPRWDSPLDIFIIPHFLWFVKRFFNFFENFLHHSVAHSLTLGVMVSIPLDIVIIPHPKAKCNSQSIQNGIKYFIYFCAFFLLTTARPMWYNSSGLSDPGEHSRAKIEKDLPAAGLSLLMDDSDFIIADGAGVILCFYSVFGFINCGQFPMFAALTETIVPSLLVADLLTPQRNRSKKPKADTENCATDFVLDCCAAGDEHYDYRNCEKAKANKIKPKHFIYLFS